jgi:hypothetical protein
VSVIDLHFPTIDLLILLQENMCTDPENIQIAHSHMNVEVGTEAVHFPEKEYVNGIFVAVRVPHSTCSNSDSAGVILYVMDGPYRLPFPYRIHLFAVALTGAPQLRGDAISSCCYIVNVHNHPS